MRSAGGIVMADAFNDPPPLPHAEIGACKAIRGPPCWSKRHSDVIAACGVFRVAAQLGAVNVIGLGIR
jgi:hypothetical protein